MTLSDSEAKVLAMVVIGVGSFLVGLFPACFTHRRGERKLLLSSMLCFGAGILLATAMLHMLPETRDSLPDYAELALCAGFLFLYMVDEIVHLVWGRVIDLSPAEVHSHQTITAQRQEPPQSQPHKNHLASHGCGHAHTGASTSSEHHHEVVNHFLPPSVSTFPNSVLQNQTGYEPNVKSNIYRSRDGNHSHYGSVTEVHPPSTIIPASCCGEKETLLCHGPHTEPCANTNAGLAGLLIALTLHAILEGLAVGLQTEAQKVLLLLGAVASHKLVVGFCLGMEFAATASTFLRHLIAIAVFAGGSSAGIGIGMLVTQMEENWVSNVLMPVLQGIAAGSLLYVTVSEVLPRERARWHKTARRMAGVIQFFSVTCGFVFMFILMKYTGDVDANTEDGEA